MSEKEKMAAALFSGLGGTSKPSPPAPTPAPKRTPTPPPVQVAAPAPVVPVAAPAPQKAAPPAPDVGLMDLLDLDDGGASNGNVKAPAQPTRPPPTTSPDNDMLLLDFGGAAPAPAPTFVQAPVQPTPAPPPAMPPAPTHILGPLQVTTAQVGSMWGQLPSQRESQLSTTIGTCQEMMVRLQTKLNVHPVEIIGMEGIAAGRVLPGNDPCFLHGKLAPPHLHILVRCQNPGVAQTVVDLCTRILA